MSELFREIEDDIKRERYEKLWQGFGKVMVGVSLIIVVCTIGIVIWQNHKQAKAMDNTTDFIKGIDRLNIEDYKGAIGAFDKLSEEPGSSYYGLALLRKAQAQNALSDHDGAHKTYQVLAEHDVVFGELAKMMLPPENGDVAKPRMGAPFYYAQSEARGWQLLKLGKKENAVAQFLAIYRDPKAPYSMHGRVTEALQYLAPDMLAQENKAMKDALGKAKGPTDE